MILAGDKRLLVFQRPFLPCRQNSCFQSACKFASLSGAQDDPRYFQISVPEPSMFALAGLGLLVLDGCRRHAQKQV